MASRLGPAKPRAIAWNGAGGCVIVSQDRQLNFSRTCSVTNHCRGTTSTVSVTSSPTFGSCAAPQIGRKGAPCRLAPLEAAHLNAGRSLGLRVVLCGRRGQLLKL